MTSGPSEKTLGPTEGAVVGQPTSISEWRPGAAMDSLSGAALFGVYAELAKLRLTTLILLVVAAGFWLASPGPFDAGLFLTTTAAVALLAGGIFSLNQYLERDLDALMRRTEARPLPTGRLQPFAVLWFGTITSAAAFALLAVRVNLLAAALSLFVFVTYLFVYTPLKRLTPHCTFFGAIPGAMPPLIGWAAASGELSAGAAALFLILFLWQFPHFHSIGWLYREDYARADIKMWPVVEPEGRTMSREVIGYAALLLPVSAAPSVLGITGSAYLAGAALLGMGLLYLGVRMAMRKSRSGARRLLVASVFYLPLLFALMVLDK